MVGFGAGRTPSDEHDSGRGPLEVGDGMVWHYELCGRRSGEPVPARCSSLAVRWNGSALGGAQNVQGDEPS